MTLSAEPFEIFLTAIPGLEPFLLQEAKALGLGPLRPVAGGVTFIGNWQDVWRANLELRGATRILARVASFKAFHLAQLDKRSHKVAWDQLFTPGTPIRVEAVCRKSKIYHDRAAAERIAKAIVDISGARLDGDDPLTVKARIEDNHVTISVDTSGELLHKRGYKQATGKAPLRETMAALLLRACGYTGAEPILDPMCGSGTIPIEAAEIALGSQPGRARAFAFERLRGFDGDQFAALRRTVPSDVPFRFYGSDRNAGAIENATQNAARAGVGHLCQFAQHSISDLNPPDGPAGLVLINPPYGARIGDKKPLFALYGSLGEVLRSRFSGWRVGFITPDAQLAHATKLPFSPMGPPIAHGGLKVKLYRTAALP